MMTMTSEPGDGLKRRPPMPNVVRWESDLNGVVRKLWHPGFLTKHLGCISSSKRCDPSGQTQMSRARGRWVRIFQ